MSPRKTARYILAMSAVAVLHAVGSVFLGVAKAAAVVSGLIYVTLTDWSDRIESWGKRSDLQNLDPRE